jgi:hypothetical protein
MELARETKAQRVSDTTTHFENFLTAVRSRRYEDLNCDVETGALSAAMCHLANISYRLGRKVNWDAAAGKFVKDGEADKMISRNYRAPYVVPERV